MSFTNFLETEILDHVLAGAAYTAPGTKYIGLFTAAPGETGGGTEVSGSAYARQTMAFSTSVTQPAIVRLLNFLQQQVLGVR